MKHLTFLLSLLPFITCAQETGIKWTEGLNWEQVKDKAKVDNKYIFIDCFATWCGPCKQMDKDVFNLDSVGDFFNDRFISIKVQMDVTKKDEPAVQAWYDDAQGIRNKFGVQGYPTFLIFSPDGVLLEKQAGFIPPADLINLTRVAIQPGHVYIDPLDRYNRLMSKYKTGKKDYDSLYYMFETATSLGDTSTVRLLGNDIISNLGTMHENQLYTPERLQFMQAITTKPSSRWFYIFYKHPKKVNRVMKDANYAQRVVDEIILKGVAYPFLKMRPPGMLMGSAGKVKADLAEADWSTLEKELNRQFNLYYAKKNTLAAKFVWYKQHWNLQAFIISYIQYLERYGIDSHEWTTTGIINNTFYNDIFLTINDHRILNQAIKLMEEVVEKTPTHHHLDTYASLLYKAGRQKKAIWWEEQALKKAYADKYAARHIPFFQSVIDKMKKGEKLNWQD